jgi:hypothetical protein
MTNQAYYAEFGEFIHWYSKVERTVHYLFRHYCEAPPGVARAIDGGMALSSLVSLIKRVMEIRNIETSECSKVNVVFEHLNHVSLLREALIHRGGDSAGNKVVSTNVHFAKTKADLEFLELELDDIIAASSDCRKIYLRLDRIMNPDRPG